MGPIFAFLIVAVVSIWTGATEAAVTVKVTGDNSVELFADGQLMGDDFWNAGAAATKSFNIPTSTRVIGLKGFDYGGLGGIIASVSDGMVTDASWKCSATYAEGWSTAQFDDSNWATATTYDRADGQRPTDVASGAEWIWTQNYHFEDQIVYCRKARPTVTVRMTADNAVDLFVDGVYMGEDHWKATLVNGLWNPIPAHLVSVAIPASSRVIGLRGFDYGVIGGIIADVSDGTVTDDSWKCFNTYAEGWSTEAFDDGNWAAATAYSRPEAMPPGISSSAKFIWTSEYNFGDKVVYCRKVR